MTNAATDGVHAVPANLQQALRNVEIGLGALRTTGSVPPDLLRHGTQIVRGRLDLLWEVLGHVMRTYGVGDGSRVPAFGVGAGSRPPYSPEKMQALECSLVDWMYSLGIMSKSSSNPEAAGELTAGCSDGTTLCRLASLLQGQRIPGVAWQPRVAAAQLGNIRKACDLLQKNKLMCSENLFADSEVRAAKFRMQCCQILIV